MKRRNFRGARLTSERGQSMALMAVALPAFVGALGLAMDVGALYFTKYRLQTAVDASALAGATCIAFPTSSSCTAGPSIVAGDYATNNGLASTELTPYPPAPPTTNSTYCPTTNCEITVSATRSVPYHFARLVGVSSGTVDVTASAIGGPINTITGSSSLLPIGLQYQTVAEFSANNSISNLVALGTSGCPTGGCVAGNWGWLSFDATGHEAVNTQIQYGYTGTVTEVPAGTVCNGTNTQNCTLPQPGAGTSSFKTVSDYRTCPAVSCADAYQYSPTTNPCVVTVPLVDWNLCPAGRCPANGVPVLGFAEILIQNVTGAGSSQDISACWVADDVPGGGISGSAPAGCEGGPSGTTPCGAIAIQLIQ